MPVVVITPDYEIEIVPDPFDLNLKFLQQEVEGWIENTEICVFSDKKQIVLQMWVNEEGLLKKLHYNSLATHLRQLHNGPGGQIVGNVVITGLTDDGDLATLTEQEFVALMDEVVAYAKESERWFGDGAPTIVDNPDK